MALRQARHLDGDHRGVLADVVAPGALRARQRLGLVLGGEDAEGHGTPVVSCTCWMPGAASPATSS